MNTFFFAFIFICACITCHSSPVLNTIQIDEPQDDVIDLSRLGTMLFSEPDEAVGLAVKSWTPEDSINPEELGTYAEGDMLIPGVDGRNGLVQTSRRWENGIIPYVFSSNVAYQDRNLIETAMKEYHKYTCLKFQSRTTEKDYISFESDSTGCWSSVGKVGKRQVVNLQSPGCTTKIGTALHEIMHAVGFFHEQNRADRDNYVKINYRNIKPETIPNFDKAGPGETNDFGVSYDKTSVMHYSGTAFSSNGDRTIIPLNGDDTGMGQRDGFRMSDLAKINAMYNCGNQAIGSVGGSYPSESNNPSTSSVYPGTKPSSGFTNPLAAGISAVGSFLQSLGKHK